MRHQSCEATTSMRAPKHVVTAAAKQRNARIIADQKEACLAESGDFIIPMKEGKWNESMIAGDLGAVVAGAVKGRTSPDEITLFKSVGLAIQDISVAFHVYNKAVEMDVGIEFTF